MQRFFLLVWVLLGDWKTRRLALLTIFSGFPNNRHNSLWWTPGRQKALLCECRQPSLLNADLWWQQGEHRSKCVLLQAGGTLGEAPQSWACGGPRGEPCGCRRGSTGGTCCALAWGLPSSQGPLFSKACGDRCSTTLPLPHSGYSPTLSTFLQAWGARWCSVSRPS